MEDFGFLLETQLLSCRHDVVRGRVALLLECRQALQIREGNVAVLLATGVRSLAWAAPGRRAARTAWSVVGGSRRQDDDGLELRVRLLPSGELTIRAERTALHVVQVPGLPEAPADYTGPEGDVLAGTPTWESAAGVVASYRF